MCLTLSSTSRSSSPRPQPSRHRLQSVRPAISASAKSTSRYDDEHIIGPPSRSVNPRARYIYGPDGDIIGTRGTDSGNADLRKRAISRASAPSRSRYDDEHVISARRRDDVGLVEYGMAPSVSKGGEEPVISARPRDPYVLGTNGRVLGVREDEDRPSESVTAYGAVSSTSRYGDEHIMSSRNVKGASSGSAPGQAGIWGMFQGESRHGEGRRVGERHVGTKYGPGAYLSGKNLTGQRKKETKVDGGGGSGSGSGRPKVYGF